MKTDISEEQIEQCREIFNLYDKDGDGTIDSRELGDIMRSLGIYPSNEEVLEMLKEVDTDKSGKIDFEEFLDLFTKKINEPDTEEEAEEMIKSADDDGDGTINFKEFCDIITKPPKDNK